MFWILAASWEFESNGNVSTSRKLFQQGLRLNTKNAKLWLEYFKMEMLYFEKVRLRKQLVLSGVEEQVKEESEDEMSEDEDKDEEDKQEKVEYDLMSVVSCYFCFCGNSWLFHL